MNGLLPHSRLNTKLYADFIVLDCYLVICSGFHWNIWLSFLLVIICVYVLLLWQWLWHPSTQLIELLNIIVNISLKRADTILQTLFEFWNVEGTLEHLYQTILVFLKFSDFALKLLLFARSVCVIWSLLLLLALLHRMILCVLMTKIRLWWWHHYWVLVEAGHAAVCLVVVLRLWHVHLFVFVEST